MTVNDFPDFPPKDMADEISYAAHDALYRGDNPGILIGAMIVIIAVFAYLLRDTGFMSMSNTLSIVRVSTTITRTS